MRGVDRHDLAGDQPVEEHANGGQLLLDGGLGVRLPQLLDIGGDRHGSDVLQGVNAASLAPVQEGEGVAVIGPAGVRIADLGGEILDEAGDGVFPGGGQDRRHPRGRN